MSISALQDIHCVYVPKEWLCVMYNAFIGLVVGIDEQTTPTFWKSTSIHCKSVVLCRNVAAYRVVVGTWQVMSPISIPTRNRCKILDMHTRDCFVQQVVSTSSLQNNVPFSLFHICSRIFVFCFFYWNTQFPFFMHLIAIFAQFITSFYLWLRFKFLMLTSIIMHHQISWLPLIIPTKYTHLILNVLAPMAKDRSWWPRQIPNMGLYFSSLTTLLKLSMVALHIWGSPGPLLMNNPSYSVHKQHNVFIIA